MTETQEAINSDFALVGSFSLFDGYGCSALPATPPCPTSLSRSMPGECAARRLQRTTAVRSGDPRTGRVPQEALPEGHDCWPHRLGCLLGRDADGLSIRRPEEPGLQDRLRRRHQPAAVRLHPRRDQHEGKGRQRGRSDRDRLAGRGHLRRERRNPELAPRADLPGRARLRRPVHLPCRRTGGDQGIQIGQVYALYLGEDAGKVPAVKQFDTYVKKVNPTWSPDLYTLFGWASAEMFVQALKAAGPHPTRGSVIASSRRSRASTSTGSSAARTRRPRR